MWLSGPPTSQHTDSHPCTRPRWSRSLSWWSRSLTKANNWTKREPNQHVDFSNLFFKYFSWLGGGLKRPQKHRTGRSGRVSHKWGLVKVQKSCFVFFGSLSLSTAEYPPTEPRISPNSRVSSLAGSSGLCFRRRITPTHPPTHPPNKKQVYKYPIQFLGDCSVFL